jgi:trigger factor
MNISLYNQETARGILQMEIDKSDYIDQVEKGLRNARMTARIHGFRQGMAPIGIIKNIYGKQILLDELNKLVSEALKTYFQDNPDIKLLGTVVPNVESFKNLEIERMGSITVTFDLPMSPKVDMELGPDDRIPYLKIVLEDEFIDMQLQKYRHDFGDYDEDIDTVIPGNLLITGNMEELENGLPKEDGIIVRNAELLSLGIRNGEEAAKFVDATKGSVVVFNPRKVYEGATNTNAIIAKLLGKTQQEVEMIDSDFSFEIVSIQRFNKSPLDQPFFDYMFGQDVVKTLEEFMELFRTKLADMYVGESNYRLLAELRPYLLNKAGELPIDEELLKRQILSEDEEANEADIDENMPDTLEGIRYRLVVDHLLQRYNMRVSKEELERRASIEAQRTFINYGMHVPEPSITQAYAANLLNDPKVAAQISLAAKEDKLVILAKERMTLEVKEISISDLEKLRIEESKGAESNNSESTDAESNNSESTDAASE